MSCCSERSRGERDDESNVHATINAEQQVDRRCARYKSAGTGFELPTLCSISMSNSKLLLPGMYQAPPCTPGSCVLRDNDEFNKSEVNGTAGDLAAIYLASLRRRAVTELGGHVNARAFAFAHLDEWENKTETPLRRKPVSRQRDAKPAGRRRSSPESSCGRA